MRLKFNTSSTLILLIALNGYCAWDPCTPDLPAGSECKEEIKSLHPTQPEVGRREVKRKIEEYSSLKADDLKSKMKEKIAPVIIGPDGQYYLYDHHHSTLAFWEMGEKEAYVKVMENWSKLGEGKPSRERMKIFWRKMEDNHYAWLEKENGEKVNPLGQEFPKTLEECGNSKMRSVVSELIDEGLIKKRDAPFYEFGVIKKLKENGVSYIGQKYKELYAKAESFLKSPEGKTLMKDPDCFLLHFNSRLSSP